MRLYQITRIVFYLCIVGLIVFFIVYFTKRTMKSDSKIDIVKDYLNENKNRKENNNKNENNENKNENKLLFLEKKFKRESTIFCIIPSFQAKYSEKSFAVHETWAKECDKYVFVTKIIDFNMTIEIENEDKMPLLQPAYLVSEDEEKRVENTYLTIADLYNGYDGYDWYLKADDDTYVFVEHLREFLRDKDFNELVVYGNKLLYDDMEFLSGGAGYVLSREAFKRLANTLIEDRESCPDTRSEDIDVVTCLRRLQVTIGVSTDDEGRERFHPYDITTHLEDDTDYEDSKKKGDLCCSDSSISFHKMNSDDMRKIDEIWKEYKNNKKMGLTKESFRSGVLYKMFKNE